MSMRVGVVAAAVALTLVAGCSGEPTVEQGDARLAARCDSLTQAFAVSLKGELVAALAEGGAAFAVEVCKSTAPAVADEHSRRPGWRIRRVSAGWRNPDNQPDHYEASVLERMADSESVAVEYSWRKDPAGDSNFVYMKAIRTADVCLNCHGPREQLDSTLVATLAREYPDDRATGYRKGDLRGAFVVEVDGEAARLAKREAVSGGSP